MVRVIFTFLILTSCAFRIEDDESIRKQAADQILETLVRSTTSERVSKDEIGIQLGDDEGFNKFQLSITWPIRTYRAEIKIDNEKIESLIHSYSKRNIEGHPGLLHISVTLFNELGGVIGHHDESREFHKDIQISEPISLEEELIVNRLLITTGGRIITNGHDLTIKAKKIIIEDTYNPGAAFRPEDAHILTVLPGTKSSTTEGKPAHARIKIEAKEAVGDLRVALIGFDGNDGVTPIFEHPQASPGKDGTPGESQDIAKYCADERGRPCRSEFVCKVNPTKAEKGEPGKRGLQGASGQEGGDSGDLVIEIENSDYFTAKVLTLPGSGGIRGVPGKGGLGGLPGKTPAPARGCKATAPADRGDDGADGPEGEDGKPGQVGHIDTKKTRSNITK